MFTKTQKQLITKKAKLLRELAVVEAKLAAKKAK
jgi:hypothetical protein